MGEQKQNLVLWVHLYSLFTHFYHVSYRNQAKLGKRSSFSPILPHFGQQKSNKSNNVGMSHS